MPLYIARRTETAWLFTGWRTPQEGNDERQSAQSQELGYLEDTTQILRARPVEAGVDSKFEDVPEQEQRRLYRRSFQSWPERALDQSRPGVWRVLTRLAWNSTSSPVDELEEAGWKLIEWRDFDSSWRCEPFYRIVRIDELSELVRRLSGLSKRCQKPSDKLYRALAPARELDSWLQRTNEQPDYQTPPPPPPSLEPKPGSVVTQ